MTAKTVDPKIMQALLDTPGMKKKIKGMKKNALDKFKKALVDNKIYAHFARTYEPAEEESEE